MQGRLDSLLHAAHERGVLFGNALVARGDRVVYQGQFGYADAAATEPLTPQHLFHIGSVTKGFSAVGLALLAEQGRLRLDDPLSHHLGGLPGWGERVRVRDLLRYTSGLPGVDYDRVRSDADIYADLRAVEQLRFGPGTDFHYNNNDIFLRHRVIEAVAGVPYPEFVRTRLFEPCGMTSAVVDPAPGSPRLARAFDAARVEDTERNPMSGSVAVTTTDLYRWTRCVHAGELITPGSVLELMRSAGGQSALGMGEVEDGELRWQAHTGSLYSFQAVTYYHRGDNLYVVLLTNSRGNQVASLAGAVQQAVLGEPFEVPGRSLEMVLRAEIEHHGWERGMALLDEIERERADQYELTDVEGELTETGEYLLQEGQLENAIGMYRLVAVRYPESAAAHRGLAEAHLAAGDGTPAAEHARRALELDPEDERARRILERTGR